jgi:precorrin isomerase
VLKRVSTLAAAPIAGNDVHAVCGGEGSAVSVVVGMPVGLGRLATAPRRLESQHPQCRSTAAAAARKALQSPAMTSGNT